MNEPLLVPTCVSFSTGYSQLYSRVTDLSSREKPKAKCPKEKNQSRFGAATCAAPAPFSDGLDVILPLFEHASFFDGTEHTVYPNLLRYGGPVKAVDKMGVVSVASCGGC